MAGHDRPTPQIETMGGFDVQPEHWKLLVKRIISNPAMIVPTYENPT